MTDSEWKKKLEEAKAFQKRDEGRLTASVLSHDRREDVSRAGDLCTSGQKNHPKQILLPSNKAIIINSYPDLLGSGIRIFGLFSEIVVFHPLLVFRRQAQIRHDSMCYHLTPFTVVPIIFRLLSLQGWHCLWKGCYSVFVLRGIHFLAENVISEFTDLPKEINAHSSLQKCLKHMTLKTIAFTVTCSFYAASVLETVESKIASESSTLTSYFQECLRRLLLWKSGSGWSMLPIWKLMPSVVFYQVMHYVSKNILSHIVHVYMCGSASSSEFIDTDLSIDALELYERYYGDIFACFTATLLTDMLFYPLEVVVNRLCVQGTRTIIDNMDNGVDVLPLTLAYTGLKDAVVTMVNVEGSQGFYKGFGSLVLQGFLTFSFLYFVRHCYEQWLCYYGDGRPPSMHS